jgi:predicted nucleic acid-binding protein
MYLSTSAGPPARPTLCRLHRVIDEILDGRVLQFDRTAAETAATIAAGQRQIGRSVEIRDVQIAGIAAARKATLATRNTHHFTDLGITLVDPWRS